MNTNYEKPAIYVGTYSKYNACNLAGKWLNLSDYANRDEFLAACRELHSDESDPEFMFQDYECFPKRYYNESSAPPDEFWTEWLECEEDQREAFAVFLDNGSGDTLRDFQDAYLGTFRDLEAYAEDYIEQSGSLEGVPDMVARYFNYAAFAQDLHLGGDIWTADGGKGVFVFSN